MKKKTAFVMKAGEAKNIDDPVDQANLDLHFVEAFIDLLWSVNSLDELKKGSVSAMCHESKNKIERLKRFIEAIPINTVKAA